ncbi:MAG TPA: hypothetical protein PLG97_07855 [Alcaligenes sp.]|nr:hypothetical protein [Alcaligenes sp.]
MHILVRAHVSAGVLMFCLTGMLFGPAVAAQNSMGLERLSSTQVYGVQEAQAVPAQELPPPTPFFDPAQWQDDAQPTYDTTPALSFSDLSLAGAETASLARSIQYSRQSSPLWRARWLRSSADQVWVFGERNWRYVGEQGLELTLGNDTIAGADWAQPVSMGGVNLTQAFEQGPGGPWRYALALGALDATGNRDNGDLVYGATAGSLLVSTDVATHTSVDAQMESARDFSMTGVGATYRSPDWGVWQASVARASHSLGQGWRYQAAYGMDVLDDLRLEWRGERYQDRFVDLSRYQGMKMAAASRRQVLGATVPLRRWGELNTQYEVQHPLAGGVNRYVGVSQQFWYSPSLRVGLQARRHLESRQSNVALRFSVPIF